MKRTALKRKTALKKATSTPVSKLKKELWQLCRTLILSKYGSDCYTCPARNLTGSNRHLGHFISSSICSAEMRYDLSNLRPQCYACNIHRSGNWPAYEAHLLEDGVDVAALKQRNRDTIGMKADSLWYLAKINEYKTLASDIEMVAINL